METKDHRLLKNPLKPCALSWHAVVPYGHAVPNGCGRVGALGAVWSVSWVDIAVQWVSRRCYEGSEVLGQCAK